MFGSVARPAPAAMSAPLRSATLWRRMAGGRPGPLDVAAIVAGAVLLCGSGLVGLDALLVHRAAPSAELAPPRRDQRPFAPRDLARYTGHWISATGASLIVTRQGAMWADGGALLGEARPDGEDASRVVFEGTGFRCRYRVSAEREDSLDWNVVEGSPPTRCPEGRFNRHFTF